MRVRFLLRALFLLLLAFIKVMFGMDWAFVFGMAVIAADLDEISAILERKFRKDCK